MKKIMLCLMFLFFVASFALAEPWDYQYTTSQPATVNEDGALFYRIVIDLNSNAFVVRYRGYSNDDGVLRDESVRVYNRTDDPSTDDADCTASGVPYSCCTGDGTGDCDESTTDWADVAGYQITAGDEDKYLLNILRTKLGLKVKTQENFPAGTLN